MELPDLVRAELGDEEIRAGVSLGDEDAVALTPTRTLVYRGEGLLSDESVSEFPHEVERLDLTEGRRKTKFGFEYVDGTDSFTVPNSRAEKVLELVLEGVLRVGGVIEPDESVRGVFRFSELTVVITDGRLVKHIGSVLWDADYEAFPFDAVTGLAFEEGSVATQIVLSIDGRPQRIKAPNDEAPKFRQTVQQALFDYYDVESMEALDAAVAPAEGAEAEAAAGDANDLTLEDGIDPLVGGSADPDDDRSASASAAPADTEDAQAADPAGSDTERTVETASSADLDAVGEQLESLTVAVERQNELLEKHQRTIAKLIEELRQGR